MSEGLRRLLDLGLGLAVLTKETAESIVNELVSKGQVSREEGRKLLDNLGTKGEQLRADLGRHVAELVKTQLASLDLVRGERVAALEKRVRELEQALAKLRGEAGPLSEGSHLDE
ncbi:MAG: hypothetical protein AB1486_25450 [Planctomycetota bacterium]